MKRVSRITRSSEWDGWFYNQTRSRRGRHGWACQSRYGLGWVIHCIRPNPHSFIVSCHWPFYHAPTCTAAIAESFVSCSRAMRRPLKNRVPDEPMYVQVSTRPTLTHAHSTRHARPRGGHVHHGCARDSTFRVDERERRIERTSLRPLFQCVRVCDEQRLVRSTA